MAKKGQPVSEAVFEKIEQETKNLLPLRGNLKPRASGVFGFCGNIRCGINCFMPQGFEARSVV